jgi:hypothetical protein
MVHKRKNGGFNRDAFAPSAQVERVENAGNVNAVIKQHKSQSFLFGLMVGFILNTVLAVTLVSVQADIDYKNSQAGIDEVIKAKINAINTKLESMEEFSHVPAPGEEAKEMNENY